MKHTCPKLLAKNANKENSGDKSMPAMIVMDSVNEVNNMLAGCNQCGEKGASGMVCGVCFVGKCVNEVADQDENGDATFVMLELYSKISRCGRCGEAGIHGKDCEFCSGKTVLDLAAHQIDELRAGQCWQCGDVSWDRNSHPCELCPWVPTPSSEAGGQYVDFDDIDSIHGTTENVTADWNESKRVYRDGIPSEVPVVDQEEEWPNQSMSVYPHNPGLTPLSIQLLDMVEHRRDLLFNEMLVQIHNMHLDMARRHPKPTYSIKYFLKYASVMIFKEYKTARPNRDFVNAFVFNLVNMRIQTVVKFLSVISHINGSLEYRGLPTLEAAS
jgi:hypothetical protein